MSRNRIPLPAGPRTSAAWQLFRYSQSPLPFLEQCSRGFGDPFTFSQLRLFRPPGSRSYPVRRGIPLAPHDGTRTIVTARL